MFKISVRIMTVWQTTCCVLVLWGQSELSIVASILQALSRALCYATTLALPPAKCLVSYSSSPPTQHLLYYYSPVAPIYHLDIDFPNPLILSRPT